VVLLADDVRSSLDGMFSEPPAMLDVTIVLLQIGDEATEDQEVRDGATKPTPEPIPSTRLLIGTTNMQEPVPNHVVTLATLFVVQRDPSGPITPYRATPLAKERQFATVGPLQTMGDTVRYFSDRCGYLDHAGAVGAALLMKVVGRRWRPGTRKTLSPCRAWMTPTTTGAVLGEPPCRRQRQLATAHYA
jgi:hypothetical protein